MIPKSLVQHPLSLVGVGVTTISATLFLVVFLLDLLGFHTNPYIGIVVFLILPGLFVAGLLLIPAGGWLERRRRRAGHEAGERRWPRFDLNDPHQRRLAFFVVLATLVNVVVVSLAAYRGVEYMDSVAFCGQVCHQVMQPEFTAYHDSPHARVTCVECHIGPGAPWFVKSKLSGTRQVFAVLFHTYPRPIPSPVEDLRPARETCEQCHWPEKFTGDRIATKRAYAADEANTESVTNLRLHVGGGSQRPGRAVGIHWHMSPSIRVRYVTTDTRRQVIPFVEVEDPQGRKRVYRVEGTPQADIDQGEERLMDCMDCHNRPSHPFAPTPEVAIDDLLATGEIPRSLPYAKRQAVEAVTARYPTREAAMDAIAGGLAEFYRAQYPQAASHEVKALIDGARQAYGRNVFPQMNVSFGTYLLNIGHTHSAGCFRCHDDNHKAEDGSTIRQDCELCHEMLPG
jgi:hypothetical protein